MTGIDVLQLQPGDSLISLVGPWDDELPVVQVADQFFTRRGRVHRHVYARIGAVVQPLTVREGDAFVRCPCRFREVACSSAT